MKRTTWLALFIMIGGHSAMGQGLYDFTLDDIDGRPLPLKQFSGNVMLLVNVASKCGFTKQYPGLETLYQRYKNRGLVVLGFPANNFLNQEPGTNEEIKQFCTLTHNVSFPMFAKISVKGKTMHPLYRFLTGQKGPHINPGGISWNFNKFLADRGGNIQYRFGSRTEPLSDEMIGAVEALLDDSTAAGP